MKVINEKLINVSTIFQKHKEPVEILAVFSVSFYRKTNKDIYC